MTKQKISRPRIQVCLTNEAKEEIERRARADGRSDSAWIARILERELGIDILVPKKASEGMKRALREKRG